jgi:hypothetical protein
MSKYNGLETLNTSYTFKASPKNVPKSQVNVLILSLIGGSWVDGYFAVKRLTFSCLAYVKKNNELDYN